MTDLYCYDGTNILKNKLDIQDEKALKLIESEQSRMEMMILYDLGFNDFSISGFYKIHENLFKDIYDWAGKPRIVDLIKKEELLAMSKRTASSNVKYLGIRLGSFGVSSSSAILLPNK